MIQRVAAGNFSLGGKKFHPAEPEQVNIYSKNMESG